jgi:hypothetical protein
MSYTNNDGVDTTKPDGSTTAATDIDLEIKKVKLAYNERLADVFGGDWSVSAEVTPTKLGPTIAINTNQANQDVTSAGNITGAVALDFDTIGNHYFATMTGNVTFSVANMRLGTSYVLYLKQDGTGGRTITMPSGVRYTATPTFNTSANLVTMITITPYSSTIGLAVVAGTGWNVS